MAHRRAGPGPDGTIYWLGVDRLFFSVAAPAPSAAQQTCQPRIHPGAAADGDLRARSSDERGRRRIATWRDQLQRRTHLLLGRIEHRPPRLDLTNWPKGAVLGSYQSLPKETVIQSTWLYNRLGGNMKHGRAHCCRGSISSLMRIKIPF